MRASKFDNTALNATALLNVAIIFLSMGAIWSLVIFFRAVSKGVANELGNSLVAGCSFGVGFSALYLWSAIRSGDIRIKHKIIGGLCLLVVSICMTIALHYIGVGLIP